MTEKVALREVGMRDGLQSLPPILTTEQKNIWCAAEFAAGVKEIEVTSFVPPKLLPMFADAEEVVRHSLTLDGLTVSALIPNLRGAERGIALGVHELAYVLSVSEGHNQNNVRRSTAESIADLKRVIELRDSLETGRRVKVVAGLATCFGCTIEGHVDEKRVFAIAAEVLALKPDALMIADTVGYGNPAAVRRVFREVLDMAGAVPVGAHFHNTRGLGLANVLGGARGRRAQLRRLARRPRRLPLGSGRDRQHRDGGHRLHAGDDGVRHRHRPRTTDRGSPHGRGLHAGALLSTEIFPRPAFQKTMCPGSPPRPDQSGA